MSTTGASKMSGVVEKGRAFMLRVCALRIRQRTQNVPPPVISNSQLGYLNEEMSILLSTIKVRVSTATRLLTKLLFKGRIGTLCIYQINTENSSANIDTPMLFLSMKIQNQHKLNQIGFEQHRLFVSSESNIDFSFNIKYP